MASITSLGIGSGLDIESLIGKLVAVERTPITALKKVESSLQTKLSTYGKMQSALSTLRDAAATLARAGTWQATTGVSSDAAAVGVTTGAATLPGSWAVQVQRLASVQSNATGVYPSADALVGEGTLHIELGSWGADGSSFTPQAGRGVVDISVGPPAQSLAQLRDKINASNAGVVASVLTDAAGARLVLRSAATGEANGFRVGVTDADGHNSDGLGLSALAFDPSAGILTMAQALAAANAAATLNGLPVSSASNTLGNVIDGLTLSLNKVTAAPVQVDARPDAESMRKAIDGFVTAYNDLNKLIAEQTKYDAASKTAGTLQGDSAAVAMRSRLRSLLGESSGTSASFGRLADVGFDVQSDGSIKLDQTKLANGLANLPELRKLFAHDDPLGDANDGIATRLRALADQFLGIDGSLSTRQDGLRARIERNQDRQAQLEDRIAMTEKRLRAQYTALDRQMASLTSLSGYVTQQMKTWSSNKGN
ncbi:MAG TPA: flagellar filament capping protein FliD [Rubrivivax sp.]|nr:flagellar filament capping protein FliD [Rubrivivax sp.]HRY86316.1 flagellar filament capping protein FliD [Rubrivivax sp.]